MVFCMHVAKHTQPDFALPYHSTSVFWKLLCGSHKSIIGRAFQEGCAKVTATAASTTSLSARTSLLAHNASRSGISSSKQCQLRWEEVFGYMIHAPRLHHIPCRILIPWSYRFETRSRTWCTTSLERTALPTSPPQPPGPCRLGTYPAYE